MCLCLQGGGTDEATITRIMVSRSEVDLLDIRAEFKKHYEHSLHSAIKVRRWGGHGEGYPGGCGGRGLRVGVAYVGSGFESFSVLLPSLV